MANRGTGIYDLPTIERGLATSTERAHSPPRSTTATGCAAGRGTTKFCARGGGGGGRTRAAPFHVGWGWHRERFAVPTQHDGPTYPVQVLPAEQNSHTEQRGEAQHADAQSAALDADATSLRPSHWIPERVMLKVQSSTAAANTRYQPSANAIMSTRGKVILAKDREGRFNDSSEFESRHFEATFDSTPRVKWRLPYGESKCLSE